MSPSPDGALVRFFLLTYALAWLFFILVAAAGTPTITSVQRALVLIGTFSPSMVALWLTHRAEGGAGVQRLVERTMRWRVPARWYLFAAGYMVTIKLTVAIVYRVANGAWPQFGAEPWFLIPIAIAFSTPFQAGEELGWRAYALPRLAARFGLGPASVILGVIWACWHLPLFFVRGADTYGQSFFAYLLQVVAISIAMAWIYAHTKGSLLPVMLMHAAVNNSKDIVPAASPGATNAFAFAASPVGWIGLTVAWIAAAYFLVRMPRDLPDER